MSLRYIMIHYGSYVVTWSVQTSRDQPPVIRLSVESVNLDLWLEDWKTNAGPLCVYLCIASLDQWYSVLFLAPHFIVGLFAMSNGVCISTETHCIRILENIPMTHQLQIWTKTKVQIYQYYNIYKFLTYRKYQTTKSKHDVIVVCRWHRFVRKLNRSE